MPEHHATSRDTNDGKGGHPFLSWSDVTDEVARAALGNSVPVGINVIQTGGNQPGFYASLGSGVWEFMGAGFRETGWLSGGDVTINGTDEFDISAGTISARGVREPVPFGPFIGEALLNAATEEFTIPAINSVGALVKFNRQLTDAERATHAQLQTVLHVDNATVTGIDSVRFLAEHITKATADYALAAGPINQGNSYTAASSDLTVKKSAGVTSQLMLQGAVSVAAPNQQASSEANPVVFLRVIRDGAGGFIIVPATDVPVGFWDDDTGALLATPKFVIYQFRFFNGITGCVVGQDTYDTLDEATAAVFVENPVIPATVSAVRNNLRTLFVAKGDVTDLAAGVIAGTVKIIQVSPSFPGGMVEVGSL